MELREFARLVVETPELEAKLRPAPRDLTDRRPGEPLFPMGPARSPGLRIVDSVKVPSRGGMADPRQRVRILHAFANHELQATELFAWAILAFPFAPAEFRLGLLRILGEEQRHTRMYLSRVEALGAKFGDFPVTGYFWNKVRALWTPAQFVSALSLTFENANLDHSLSYARAAREAGDEESARVMEAIHADEIRHVAFGAEWLRRLGEGEGSLWDAYRRNVEWPLRPALARGEEFDADSRRAAGLDREFIDGLASASREDEPPPR